MDRFSNRMGIANSTLVYDDIPPRLRTGVVNLVEYFAEEHEVPNLALSLFYAFDHRPSYAGSASIHDVHRLMDKLEWYEVLDACEVLWSTLDEYLHLPGTLGDLYSNRLNELLVRRGAGYQLRAGKIERVGSKAHEASIAEARGILRDEDLKGPDEQFQKAIGFFSRRPEPDCENAVKEAVSAVEGVAQVLLGDQKMILSKALKKLREEKDVHPTLIVLLEKLYAYRGDAEGVGHALTEEKEVRLEDAEFALGVSASAVVYLARLYGRGVE